MGGCECPSTGDITLAEGHSRKRCDILIKLVTLGEYHIRVDITTPWGKKYTNKTIVEGSTLTYQNGSEYTSIDVKLRHITIYKAYLEVCYYKKPVIKCTDYNNMYDCHKANCYWWDGSCHSETKPVYDNPYTNIGNWFDTIYIPVIGSYVFKPVAFFFYTLSGWYGTVNSLLDTILSWSAISTKIKSTYDIVNHKWSEVTALIPTWSDIIPTGFPTSLSALITLIKANAPGFPSWMPTSLSALITLIKANAPGLPTWMPTSLAASKTMITSTVKAAFDILNHKWSEVTALIPTWTDLLPAGYPVTALNLINKIKTTVLGSYSSIDSWFGSKKATVWGWVKALFPYDLMDAQSLLTWLGIEAGDVITTILDTPEEMFLWIKEEMEKNYTFLANSWTDWATTWAAWMENAWFEDGDAWQGIKYTFDFVCKQVWEGFGKNKTEFTEWLDISIPGFPSWMPTSLTAFKDKITLYVSDSFESILDYVFKEEK